MYPNKRRILPITLILLAVAVLWQLPRLAGAAPAELPPRPTVEPTETPAPDEPHAGATIKLRASTMPAGVWTMVQWQDAQGDWHDVEGWQGHLDDGVRRWWVAPADFGTGPFRWALYETRGGDLLTTSAGFDLPQRPYETVVVPVD